MGFSLTEAFSRLASDERPTDFTPTDDQLSILRAVAMGASEAELRGRTYLYGSYVTLEKVDLQPVPHQDGGAGCGRGGAGRALTNSPITKADILVGLRRPPEFRVDAQTSASAVRRMIRMQRVGPRIVRRRRPESLFRLPCRELSQAAKSAFARSV